MDGPLVPLKTSKESSRIFEICSKRVSKEAAFAVILLGLFFSKSLCRVDQPRISILEVFYFFLSLPWLRKEKFQ